jgi:predicted transcriptional regulator
MKGKDLLTELARRVELANGGKVNDSALARALGVTQPALGNYRKGALTPKQVANLIEKYCQARMAEMVSATVSRSSNS